MTRWRTNANYLLLFGFFCLFEVIFARFSLQAPLFWDDLHIIRVYPASELRSIWTGTHDPDHVETPGLRPLMTTFNHFRGVLFGDNAVAHHLFLLALFAIYLTMAAALARLLFEASWSIGALAGMLTFLHLDNVTHFAWLTDGIHLVTGIFLFGSILSLLQALRSGRLWWMLVSLGCVFAGLLTRDDMLVAVPLLALFAFALARQCRPLPGARRQPLILYAMGLAGVVIAYWTWRALAVPQVDVGKLTLTNAVWALMQSVQNLGDANNLVVWWSTYIGLQWLWAIAIGVVAAAVVFLLPRAVQVQIAWWGAAIVVTVLPAVVVARSNVLLFPTTFWGLLLATALVNLAKRSLACWATALAVGYLALAGSALGVTTWQVDFTPNSIKWVCEETAFAYADVKLTIPEARLAEARQRLLDKGIDSIVYLMNHIGTIMEDARKAGRYGRSAQDGIYIQRFKFLSHPYRSTHPCEGGGQWYFPGQ